MKQKQRIYAAAGVICAGAAMLMFSNPELVYKQFPQLGNLLHFNMSNSVTMEASLAAQQEKTMEAANNAIAAAEAALAEADALEASEKKINEATAWQATTADDPQPKTTLNPKVKQFVAIKVNAHPSHMPVEGEQVIMPMFDGEAVKVNVESTQTTENGDYVWSGHLDGYNTDYPIVMTYGEKSTYTTITTPQGSYSMESVNGIGWLYKNPSEIELSKPGVIDYVVPQI